MRTLVFLWLAAGVAAQVPPDLSEALFDEVRYDAYRGADWLAARIERLGPNPIPALKHEVRDHGPGYA